MRQPVLYSETTGAGAAVLLLHSGVCDSRMWDPQWSALASRYRVVRCDLRGFGRTALTAEPYRDADDVLDVLDFVGVDRVVVVGSSLGGRVALEVAGCFPERVAGLVLLCPAFRFDELSPSAQGFAEREAALLESGDLDGAAELNVRTWLGPDADDATRRFVYRMQRDALALQAEVRSKAGHDIPSVDLASIMVPTAIMSGGKDLDHFQQVAALLAESIRGARLCRLDWAGHLPNLERPAEVTALLLELLERP